MGCASPQNAGSPNIPAHHLNRLLQVAQINHPLNVNKKYEHLSKIQQSKQVGFGYRKTYSYYGLVTREEMDSKRKQFWQTRVNGQPAIWELIKTAIHIHDADLGLKMLGQNRVTLLNGSIQMCVDSKLNKYEVPIFCINQPISYSGNRMQDRNINLEYQDKKIEITIRSVKYPNGDLKVGEQTSCTIQVLKSTIKAMKQLPDTTTMRFFYNGRQMKDDKTLGNYNYNPGTVIQAMII